MAGDGVIDEEGADRVGGAVPVAEAVGVEGKGDDEKEGDAGGEVATVPVEEGGKGRAVLSGEEPAGGGGE